MNMKNKIISIAALVAYIPLGIMDILTAAYFALPFMRKILDALEMAPYEETYAAPRFYIVFPLGIIATVILAVLARKNKKYLLTVFLSFLPHVFEVIAILYYSSSYPDTPTLLTVIYWITLLASIFFTAAVIYVTVKSLKEDKPA